ncbi:MAG TPA: CopG family transcriptional regulator [Thermohalobaculum sp.]|nr:CopG family transcriptional regulator [Thermohalobaculum sp.]
MAKATLSFRTDETVRDRLDRLAESRRRDRSFLINEAIERYFEIEDWQEARIREGISEADRGEFASDDEVEAVFAKWRRACG